MRGGGRTNLESTMCLESTECLESTICLRGTERI
jgi:hypothetical protein